MRRGDTLDPLDSKGMLPPEVQRLSEITGGLIDESTMYSTAFGEKNFNSQTFSETSLLQQAARLPLIGPQRLGGFGISSTIEMALMMLKERGISFDKNGYQIKASEIPDDIEVKAKLDVILPQEKLQMVNIGLNMQKLGIPDEYIQNNLMGITNTKELKRQFVQQQAEASLLQYKLERKVNKIQKSDEQRDKAKDQQLQQAIAEAQQAAGQQPAAPEPAALQQPQPAMTQGQAIDMQMLQNAYTGQPAAQPEPGLPGAGPEVMPGMEMEGGLPGAMGGMIPGQGLAGTPDETGMMR
jgi:hypothetical protein